MNIYKSITEWEGYRDSVLNQLANKNSSQGFGFVPTMGALHQGHLSLVKQSLKENHKTVVTIFVNQTQFNNAEDFGNYPLTMDEDIEALSALGVDALLIPSFQEIYPDDYRYQVDEVELSQELCGKDRPGHFKGVLTVVMKLLNLTKAKKAYFGEKDYQQFMLIKGMQEAFFMDVEIICCATARDTKGLALSSRNLRLSTIEVALAQKINGVIADDSLDIASVATQLSQMGIDLNYLKELWGRRFVAAKIGPVRIIDNVPCET